MVRKRSLISASGYASRCCTASSIAPFLRDADLGPPAPRHAAFPDAASDSCAIALPEFHRTPKLAAQHKQVPRCACSREKRTSLRALQSPGKPHPPRIAHFPAENLATTIAVHGFPDYPESIHHSRERTARDA